MYATQDRQLIFIRGSKTFYPQLRATRPWHRNNSSHLDQVRVPKHGTDHVTGQSQRSRKAPQVLCTLKFRDDIGSNLWETLHLSLAPHSQSSLSLQINCKPSPLGRFIGKQVQTLSGERMSLAALRPNDFLVLSTTGSQVRSVGATQTNTSSSRQSKVISSYCVYSTTIKGPRDTWQAPTNIGQHGLKLQRRAVTFRCRLLQGSGAMDTDVDGVIHCTDNNEGGSTCNRKRKMGHSDESSADIENQDDHGRDGNTNAGDDGDDRHKRARPLRQDEINGSAAANSVYLACPFYKKDMIRHERCLMLQLKRIKDLKQHLRRSHQQPHFCSVCGLTFTTQRDRDDHLMSRVCLARDFVTPEGLTQDQSQELQSRVSRTASLEDQWYIVWDLIFPDTLRPKSPFVHGVLREALTSVIQYWEEHGPELVSRFTRSEDFASFESRLRSRNSGPGFSSLFLAIGSQVLGSAVESMYADTGNHISSPSALLETDYDNVTSTNSRAVGLTSNVGTATKGNKTETTSLSECATADLGSENSETALHDVHISGEFDTSRRLIADDSTSVVTENHGATASLPTFDGLLRPRDNHAGKN